MELNYIKALGNFIQYYDSDLFYIQRFQEYKNNPINTNEYTQKGKGTFKSFINEYKVSRHVYVGKTEELLETTINWILNKNPQDIEGLAKFLKKNEITHVLATSLVSKILFLNNPWNIFPIDKWTKIALEIKNNDYKLFSMKVNEFKVSKIGVVNQYLDSVNDHLKEIEKPFKGKLNDLKTIRQNRFVDKILWISGQNI
jgi:hypothetical protein